MVIGIIIGIIISLFYIIIFFNFFIYAEETFLLEQHGLIHYDTAPPARPGGCVAVAVAGWQWGVAVAGWQWTVGKKWGKNGLIWSCIDRFTPFFVIFIYYYYYYFFFFEFDTCQKKKKRQFFEFFYYNEMCFFFKKLRFTHPFFNFF
jgi:hypothetical protein